MWEKLGLIFAPPGHGWMKTHAQNPFCQALDDQGTFRVHIATRDDRNRAHGSYFDFNIKNPGQILAVADTPTLGLGNLGAFDDSGVMPSSLVEYGDNFFLYYTGWAKAVDVPFTFFVGLAVASKDTRHFVRYSQAPVLGRNKHDPFMTGAPWVIREDDLFKMWYISCTQWVVEEGHPKHYYTIKYAQSHDGVEWVTSPRLCIDYQGDEYAIARPTVIKEQGIYNMRFTFRGGKNSYRIGKATSEDGIHWRRDPTYVDLETSSEGWDSQMTCYGSVFNFDGQTYMLYNGNNYGATGVGLAKWKP